MIARGPVRGELLADHRGRLQHGLVALGEPVDPGRQHGLDARRHSGIDHGANQPMGSALALKIAGLDQGPHDLFDEEWVARCALTDEVAQAA